MGRAFLKKGPPHYSFAILLWLHLGFLDNIVSIGPVPRRGKTIVAVGANPRAGSGHKSLKKTYPEGVEPWIRRV